MNNTTHFVPCLPEFDSLGDLTTRSCPSCLTFFSLIKQQAVRRSKPHIIFKYLGMSSLSHSPLLEFHGPPSDGRRRHYAERGVPQNATR